MKTTPDPEFDIREQLPYLDDLARITIRLHPRRAANLSPQSSKMGWPFLWPEDEPWPVCNATMPAKHMRAYEESLRKVSQPVKFLDVASSFVSSSKGELQSIEDNMRETISQVIQQGLEGHKMYFYPVLQLRRDEFPDLPFPVGADLFQLLWCPLIHWLGEGPGHLIYWRRESEILRPRTAPVPPDDHGFTVHSCSLDPEPITDLPAAFEAGEECVADAGRIFGDEEEGWLKYDSEFGPAPGTKLFGLPLWIQSPYYPKCSKCARDLKLLVTIASNEFGHDEPLRWVPREEQAQAAALKKRLRSSVGDERGAACNEWEEFDRPHGWMIGDAGNAYLFYCPNCPSQPVVGSAECS